MKRMKNKFTQYCSFCTANYFPALSISNYKKSSQLEDAKKRCGIFQLTTYLIFM